MLRESEVHYNTNNIIQLQGIILGKPGSGKTTVARWLGNELCDYYGHDNVNAIRSMGSLRSLISNIDDYLINFLFLDDLTLSKTDDKDIADYFRIRHVIENKTGRTNGMVITLLGLHRFYGCEPSIRTSFDFLMFRSAPSNKYDLNFTEDYIGKEQAELLGSIEIDRLRRPELFPTTFMWVKGCGSGYINTPQPLLDVLLDVGKGTGNVNKEAIYSYMLESYVYDNTTTRRRDIDSYASMDADLDEEIDEE